VTCGRCNVASNQVLGVQTDSSLSSQASTKFTFTRNTRKALIDFKTVPAIVRRPAGLRMEGLGFSFQSIGSSRLASKKLICTSDTYSDITLANVQVTRYLHLLIQYNQSHNNSFGYVPPGRCVCGRGGRGVEGREGGRGAAARLARERLIGGTLRAILDKIRLDVAILIGECR
jgi:hypothetical protein